MKLQSIIIIILFIVYFLLLYYLKKKKIENNLFIINGPLILIRSSLLLNFIHKISKKNYIWKIFSILGISLLYIGMIFMLWMIYNMDYFMILNIYSKMIPKITIFNKFHNIILIPGVNDMIPFSWGIIALIITLIIHELSHSVICFNEKVNVKSIGLLIFIIPIGGFAEPDEKELYKEKYSLKINKKELNNIKIKRLKILSSGVMGNFLIAIITFTILFGPILNMLINNNNWIITKINQDKSINNEFYLKDINNIQLKDISNIYKLQSIFLKSNEIKLILEDNNHNIKKEEILNFDSNILKISSYLIIDNIDNQSPAYYSNLSVGDIIIEMNNYKIKDIYDITNILNSKMPLDTILIKVFSNNKEKYEILNVGYKNYEKERTYIGITYSIHYYIKYSNEYKIEQKNVNNYIYNLKSIPKMLLGYNSNGDFNLKTINDGFILLTSLPFINNYSIDKNNNDNLKIFDRNIFTNNLKWILLNSSLWIGWMNLYVGLFNCLPASPLDGGGVFKTTMEIIFQKIGIDKNNNISNCFSVLITYFIYSSIFLTLLWPYICSYLLI